MKILINEKIPVSGFEVLKEKYDVTMPEGDRDFFTYDEVYDMISEYDALVVTFSFGVDRHLMQQASRLKLIACYAVGYNNVDVACATEMGIQVVNAPDPVTEPTADHAMGLLLAVARRIAEMDRRLRIPGDIQLGSFQNLGHSLWGHTLGILGFGRIGQALARRAKASGMNIIYYSRRRVDEQIEQLYNARYVSLDELMCESDVVSVNAPLTSDTVHIIGRRELAMMRPDAILINTARGKLVDEEALIEVLSNRRIFGAGIDVFEHSEFPPNELLALDNVVLTPHTGTQTEETRIELAQYTTRNIIHFFENSGFVSRVNQL